MFASERGDVRPRDNHSHVHIPTKAHMRLDGRMLIDLRPERPIPVLPDQLTSTPEITAETTPPVAAMAWIEEPSSMVWFRASLTT